MKRELMKVYLADDDMEDTLFFKEAFEELKMKTAVQTFSDGVELMNYLNALESDFPHILFLDLNMPRKSGLECLKEIKENDRYKDIAIAIYSTSSSEKDIEDTFVKGANIYIQKPSEFQQLKKILSEVLTINWQYFSSGLNKDNFVLSL